MTLAFALDLRSVLVGVGLTYAVSSGVLVVLALFSDWREDRRREREWEAKAPRW